MGFGLHAINCTHHPYGEYTIADIEHKIEKEFGDFSRFSPFMDYNAAFYVHDMDRYLDQFLEDKIEFLG